MSEELVRYEQPGELTPDQVKGQVQKIQHLMREAMQEDEHYGVIPGTRGKPTLLKPGAEKLCLMFRMDPEYEIMRAVEDPNRIHYVVKCTLYHSPSGNRIASGLGSCNSWESKYRYRKAERECPSCGAAAIIKGKEEYGGGWLCWKKKDGCGAKYDDGDKSIESQDAGQVENPDPWDQANTILKMASKRSLVAAVLNGTAASDIFTQDLEDMPSDSVSGEAPKKTSPEQTEPFQTKLAYQLTAEERKLAELWLSMEDCDELKIGKEKTRADMLLKYFLEDGASSRKVVEIVFAHCRKRWPDDPPQADPGDSGGVDITDDDIPF